MTWHPASKPPSRDGEYLIQDVNGWHHVCWYSTQWDEWSVHSPPIKVRYWAPLPKLSKPPKGKKRR